MKTTRAFMLSACVWAGCIAPDIEPRVSALAADDAYEELHALHRAGVQRGIDALDENEQRLYEEWRQRSGEDLRDLRMRFTAAGTPRDIVAPGFRIRAEDLGLDGPVSAEELAAAFLARYGSLWRVAPSVFSAADRRVQHHDSTNGRPAVSVIYQQRHAGLRVADSRISIHVDAASSDIVAVTGSFLDVRGLPTTPTLSTEDAAAAVVPEDGESIERAELIIWSPYRNGTSSAATLAYRLSVIDRAGLSTRNVVVDARTGERLQDVPTVMYALKRSLWDLRGSYSADECQRWQSTLEPHPDELDQCPPQCDACVTDIYYCALCTCADDPMDTICEDEIWRYDEVAGCVANGDPIGEGACGADALQLWSDAAQAYGYWSTSFSRDSWDNSGRWIWLKVNPYNFHAAGAAQAKRVDDDEEIDLVQVTINGGLAAPWLDGHELGHVLQYGLNSINFDDIGFYTQGFDVIEHNADAHAFRYRGLSLGQGEPFGSGYRCDQHNHAVGHYTRYETAFLGSFVNKRIGNCHGWLMTSGPTDHYGVDIAETTSLAQYDQIWFRTLDLYFDTSGNYFDWWNRLVTSSYDLFGISSAFFATYWSTIAIGRWSEYFTVGSAVPKSDRYAAAGWQHASRGPCVFYRGEGSSSNRIYWQCLHNGAWTTAQQFNNHLIDPTASEPSATFRYESGKEYMYVFWRGTNNRIRYRRFDVDTFTIGAASDMGASHLTSDVPVAAPIYESPSIDRLVVVYHPLSTPTWFYATHVGSADPPHDLGPSYDSDLPGAIVGYPYYNRIYFVRPNLSGGAGSRQVRYASYTMTGGGTWSAPPTGNNLTQLYNANPLMTPNVVRSNRGVVLAEYGVGSTKRLRMVFTTLDGIDGPELWYATLQESTPGQLTTGDYHAVPLAPLTDGSSSSAGGLAVGPAGSLIHFWGQGGSTGVSPKIYEWRTASD